MKSMIGKLQIQFTMWPLPVIFCRELEEATVWQGVESYFCLFSRCFPPKLIGIVNQKSLIGQCLSIKQKKLSIGPMSLA